MGKAALEGQAGIVKVKNGWHGSMEVNRVTYDRDIISREEIEARLKRTGTFIKTIASGSN